MLMLSPEKNDFFHKFLLSPLNFILVRQGLFTIRNIPATKIVEPDKPFSLMLAEFDQIYALVFQNDTERKENLRFEL